MTCQTPASINTAEYHICRVRRALFNSPGALVPNILGWSPPFSLTMNRTYYLVERPLGCERFLSAHRGAGAPPSLTSMSGERNALLSDFEASNITLRNSESHVYA